MDKSKGAQPRIETFGSVRLVITETTEPTHVNLRLVTGKGDKEAPVPDEEVARILPRSAYLFGEGAVGDWVAVSLLDQIRGELAPLAAPPA